MILWHTGRHGRIGRLGRVREVFRLTLLVVRVDVLARWFSNF